MYCKKCGARISDDSKFCGACGSRSSDGTPAAEPPREMSGREGGTETMPAGREEIRVHRPPVVRPYYAGFWKRFGAYIIDEVILSVIGVIMIMIVAAVIGIPMGLSGIDEDIIGPLIGVYFAIVNTILNWLYFTVMESSGRQATLGKMVMGVVVTDMNGGRISFGRANGRFWSKIISGLFLNLGYIIAGFTERKQALHDLIAATLVING